MNKLNELDLAVMEAMNILPEELLPEIEVIEDLDLMPERVFMSLYADKF